MPHVTNAKRPSHLIFEVLDHSTDLLKTYDLALSERERKREREREREAEEEEEEEKEENEEK